MGAAKAVLSLGQSSEERRCWPSMLTEWMWRQLAQILTQENISPPQKFSEGSGSVEDFPLDLGWILKPFHLDSKEMEAIKLMTSRFLLTTLICPNRTMMTYVSIHPSTRLSI